ncbi:MAG: DUF6794 domain-containing protein [Planctomycetota bacterium]
MSTRIGLTAFAVVAAVVPVALVAGRGAQPAASAELCWRSLAPETGPQDAGFAIAESALAVAGSGDIWLSRRWSGPNLLRWTAGKWTAPPEPARAGVDELWVEAVAASRSGRVVIAAAANRDDGSTELHIARMVDGAWEWLGAPLVSSQEPFTHAQRASIAFVGERPVVAWSEERHAQLVGLFVSLWNGSSWTRLGSLTPGGDDSFLTPAVAVDAHQQIWLAWIDVGGAVRVARWDGSTWRDIGRETLEKIVVTQGPTALREVSLAADAKDHVWVLRRAAKEPRGAALALARWDGSGWTAVPSPGGPAGKESTAWSASMILWNDAPVVAWSQSDATDNHHLYASEWAAGDRWTARLSDVHLVEGISNVTDVKLAAGDGRTFFVSWDEPGKDQRSIRLVQAYACAAGEKPTSPPQSIVERDTWPTTVDEAARRIVGELDDESKELVRSTKKDRLIQYHDGWGMRIRNSLGLWRGNEKLLESCGGGKRVHPDSCSTVIIEAVWTLLQASKPEA